MNTDRINFWALIGRTAHDGFYMLDYVFEDEPGGTKTFGGPKRFKGAVGSHFYPVYQEQIDEQNSVEYVLDTYGHLHEEMSRTGATMEQPEAPSEWDFEDEDGDIDVDAYTAAVKKWEQDYEYWEQDRRDWAQDMIDESDGDFFGHDTSYLHLLDENFLKEIYPDAVTFECTGGGRCFGRGIPDFVEVWRPDLITVIQNYEHACRIYDIPDLSNA